MEICCRNVNDALTKLIETFTQEGYEDKRVARTYYSNPNGSGYVLKIDEPVMITYLYPKERVLFNSVRDANPFALLYEALWMLAGRNDVAPLAYYTKRFGEFSDDGKTLNGAYGYRWRHATKDEGLSTHVELGECDQLQILISLLRGDPTTRRAVLQMWNVENDLLKIRTSKDVACNLCVMFSLRQDKEPNGPDVVQPTYLDMTVVNRSNDLLWGLLGANYVTFSILQEYMAAHLGAGVGRYHHFSNNLHVYSGRPDWRPEELLTYKIQDLYVSMEQYNEKNEGMFDLIPLVEDATTFDEEVQGFVEAHGSHKALEHIRADRLPEWSEPFLWQVAEPMMAAYHCHKINAPGMAMEWANRIRSDDWRLVATAWLERRRK